MIGRVNAFSHTKVREFLQYQGDGPDSNLSSLAGNFWLLWQGLVSTTQIADPAWPIEVPQPDVHQEEHLTRPRTHGRSRIDEESPHGL